MTDDRSLSPFYREKIAPHLPPVVLDFHAHVWRRSDWHAVPWKSGAAGAAYMVADEDYPVERLLDDGRRCFPDREYRAVCFGYPTPSADNAKDTAYVAGAGKRRGMYPLMIVGAPLEVPAAVIRQRLDEDGFLGFKVFLPWHGDAYGATRVQDMLSRVEMDIAQELGLIVLLHVPGLGAAGGSRGAGGRPVAQPASGRARGSSWPTAGVATSRRRWNGQSPR